MSDAGTFTLNADGLTGGFAGADGESLTVIMDGQGHYTQSGTNNNAGNVFVLYQITLGQAPSLLLGVRQ